MKASKLLLALSSIVFILQGVGAQTLESRPRRVGVLAYNTTRETLPISVAPVASQSELKSFVPRDGLAYYIEIRSAGLAAMARSGALATLAKSFLGSQQKAGAGLRLDSITSLPALANATIALAAYRSGSLIAFFETGSDSDAQQLKGALAQLKLS